MSETLQGGYMMWHSLNPVRLINLAEIVKFREMLEQRFERNDPPLSAIPEEHKPIIAKLAHERFYRFHFNFTELLTTYTATSL